MLLVLNDHQIQKTIKESMDPLILFFHYQASSNNLTQFQPLWLQIMHLSLSCRLTMVNETVSVLGGSGFMGRKPSQGYYYPHINENTLSNLY